MLMLLGERCETHDVLAAEERIAFPERNDVDVEMPHVLTTGRLMVFWVAHPPVGEERSLQSAPRGERCCPVSSATSPPRGASGRSDSRIRQARECDHHEDPLSGPDCPALASLVGTERAGVMQVMPVM